MLTMGGQYDDQIKAAVRAWLPRWYDWRLYKAQIFKESSMRPDAVSPAGAEGLLQFMPPTWEEVKQELNFPESATPFDPEFAILAGAYYMQKLRGQWTWERPEADRIALSLASYNAGTGNLLKAQRLAGNVSDYAGIVSKLVQITGEKNSRETLHYVTRIFGLYSGLVTGEIGH